MSFKTQLFAFLKRNYILKYRNKFQTLPEIYHPLSILAVLVLFNYLFSTEKFDPVQYAPETLGRTYLTINAYIYPNTSETQSIARLIKLNYYNIVTRFYNDTDQMKNSYLNISSKDSFINRHFGVEFSNRNFPFEYKIYSKYDDYLFKNNKVVLKGNGKECRKISNSSFQSAYESCAGNKLVYNGFANLQYNLNSAIRMFQNSNLTYSILRVQNMPKDSFVKEQVITGISSYYFTIFYMYSLITFVTNIVAEKEKKIKEVMRMMGMYDSAFW